MYSYGNSEHYYVSGNIKNTSDIASFFTKHLYDDSSYFHYNIDGLYINMKYLNNNPYYPFSTKNIGFNTF